MINSIKHLPIDTHINSKIRRIYNVFSQRKQDKKLNLNIATIDKICTKNNSIRNASKFKIKN